MKQRGLLVFLIFTLGLILIILIAALVLKYTVRKKTPPSGLRALYTTSPTAFPTDTSYKTYVLKENVFQFRYPETWLVVSLSSESAVLARTAENLTENISAPANEVQLIFNIYVTSPGVDLQNATSCNNALSNCSVVTINDQPYKKTISKDANNQQIILYETTNGNAILQVKVVVGASRQEEDLQEVQKVIDSFYWLR